MRSCRPAERILQWKRSDSKSTSDRSFQNEQVSFTAVFVRVLLNSSSYLNMKTLLSLSLHEV